MKTYVKALGIWGVIALLAAVPACKDEPPSPAKVHLMAGDKHRVASEWKEAAEEYGKSLEADPKQEKVWETKAYCHQQEGDMEAVCATLSKWAELKPDAAEKAKLFRKCGEMWWQKSNIEKAGAAYLEALKVLPTDTEALSWLGEMYSQKGGARDGKAAAVPDELDKAFKYYEKYAEIAPDKPDPYINQRVILTKLKAHYAKEQADAEALAKALEKDKDAKDKLAEATAKAEKAKAAVEETQKKIDAVTAKLVEANKKAKK